MKTIEDKIEAIINKSLEVQRLQWWIQNQHILSFTQEYYLEHDDNGNYAPSICVYNVELNLKAKQPADLLEKLSDCICEIPNAQLGNYLYYLDTTTNRYLDTYIENSIVGFYPIAINKYDTIEVTKPDLTVEQIQQQIEALCQDI